MTDSPLHVMWTPVPVAILEGQVAVSFLEVAAEEALRLSIGSVLISGREIAPSVREGARIAYTSLISSVGASPVQENRGRTFRSALADGEGSSWWWFHKVSEKDCESDPTFNDLIQLFIISKVFREGAFDSVVLHGGKGEIAAVLSSVFPVEVQGTTKAPTSFILALKGLSARLKYCVQTLGRVWATRRRHSLPNSFPDVALAGFWDWSVKCGVNGEPDDRYFKSLPSRLESLGLKTGWFLWLDPYYEPVLPRRSLTEVITALEGRSDLVLLQRFLAVTDVVRSVFDLRPYFIYRAFVGHQSFRGLFQVDGMDLFPLLHPMLVYGFLNSTLPHHALVTLSVRRAVERYRPKMTVCFLELFLHSRAFYLGCRRADPSVPMFAVQHASYCRDKTFGILDPLHEFKGAPDGLRVPVPDYIFAMGTIGKQVFEGSGFPPDRVLLTGSSRYDHVTTQGFERAEAGKAGMTVLLVTSLDLETEMDMVEAVALAARDIEGIELKLRSHPFAEIVKHPRFQEHRSLFSISSDSLENDLSNADLVIFTCSTVAEEALIRGICVWGWSTFGYNASVLHETGRTRFFCNIRELHLALRDFADNPSSWEPSREVREQVTEECFYKADHGASSRIASSIARIGIGRSIVRYDDNDKL